jgi:uncharacterized protein (TIGR02600 family)
MRKPFSKSRSGLALVIVLGMLVLAAILVIAFLSSVSTELRSAKSYAVGIDSRSLTDSAVNIVISQIQDATYTPNQNYAWASQPGMIRTYDSNGNPVTDYKLYSSNTLRVSGTFNAAGSLSTEVPTTWASYPDQYVDLNKPVTVSGVSHYPIIDPAAVANGQAGTSAMDGSSSPIQGCYMDSTGGAATTVTATQTNPVPMPVKWLYVLQDGTLATISASGNITSTGSSTPSTTNPVVGRIAFWTDDESCKVNVNTSAEGTFWARPRTDSTQSSTTGVYTGYERNFLNYTLPAQNEFQRYPGHPAMTSLSVIFPPQNGETQVAYNERVYGIIPRVVGGGSQSGTAAVTGTSTALSQDSDRLFASVDEFLFKANPRTPNLKSGTGTYFTQDDIEKTRFFLTATSRAPEVNMFNKPRITLWPIQVNPDPNTGAATQTAKDQLIAFCSTVGSSSTTGSLAYYFQRYSTYNTATTRTSTATTYMASTAAPIPSSQSPLLDWSSIARNQALYSYLQNLGSQNIPGLGGSLSGTSAKYSTNVFNQILTEIIDFIRSDVTTASTGTTPSYFYAPGQASGTEVTAERQVVPLVLSNGTKGFGRFETIQEASLVFFRRDKVTTTGSATTGYTVTQGTTSGSITVGCVLLLDPWNATPGSRSWSSNQRIVVTGLDGMKVNNLAIPTNGLGTSFPFSHTATLLLNAVDSNINQTALMGPEFFFQYFAPSGGTNYKQLFTSAPGGVMPAVGSATEEQYYPFYASFTLSGSATTFAFKPPTSITIGIYAGYDPNASSSGPSSGALVQTLTLPFPSNANNLTLPVPTVNYSTGGTAPNFTESDNNTFTDFNARIGSNGYPQQGVDVYSQHQPSPFIQSGDVVRSVEARYKGPALGDLRVLNALTTVPTAYWDSYGALSPTGNTPAADDTGVTGYSSSTTYIVHSLRMFAQQGNTETDTSHGHYAGYLGSLGVLIGTAYGQFTTGGGSNKYDVYPAVPRGLTATQVVLTGLDGATYPGDWDTGPGNQPDGPYINKPDESNSLDVAGFTTGSSAEGGRKELDEQGNTYSPNRQISSAVAFGSLPTGIDQANPTTSGSTPSHGSQSSGGIRPWQTLLFCANPASEAGNTTGTPRHPGFGSNSSGGTLSPPFTVPPDYALLDFFTMPIVEPYAISEPFSTAGKVNMNYQVVPFTYLTRDTAVRAVLKSVRMMAIPTSHAGTNSSTATCYKIGITSPPDYRYTINPDEVSGTLAGFQSRFSSGDIFRSASEICGLYLVPQYLVNGTTGGAGETISSSGPPTAVPGTISSSTMNAWWSNFALTGDNLREEPYGYIYPRLTTKSNTYTVHVITQTLKKAPSTAANTFISGTDVVTSEYRGAYIVQRYLDPNSDGLISTVTGSSTLNETDPDSVVGPYKYRVIGTKRFAP